MTRIEFISAHMRVCQRANIGTRRQCAIRLWEYNKSIGRTESLTWRDAAFPAYPRLPTDVQ